jgi:hypothetical protein
LPFWRFKFPCGPGPDSLLRNRGFLRVWLAATVAVLGESVSHLALPLTAVEFLDADAGAMGLLFAAGTLPFALFSLPAGVWLDRRRKQSIIIGFDLLGSLALGSVPVAHHFGLLSLTWLCAVNFLVGICFCVGGSAAQVFLTGLVGRERLVEANSLQASANSVAGLAGPVLAGILVATLGAPVAVAIDAAAFFASAMLIIGVRAREAAPTAGRRPVLGDLLTGLRFVWQHPLLRAFAAMAAMCIILFDGFMALYVLHASRDLGLAASDIALVNTLGAGGALAGAIAVHRANRLVGKPSAIALGFATTGLGFLIYALVPAGGYAVVLAGLAMFLVEAGMTAYTVNYLAMRQEVTPDAMLGRMTTTMRFLSVSGAPVGSALIGQVAATTGQVAMIVGLGLAALVAAAWSHRFLLRPALTLRQESAASGATAWERVE